MRGSILRHRLRGSGGAMKPPDSVISDNTTKQGYFSENANDLQNLKASIHRDGVTSPSQYESGSDSAEESDFGAAFASHQGTSGSRVASASATPTHQSSPPLEEDSPEGASRAWYEFDMSVMLALMSPIGNWLTGGDHVKNLFLILLLVFYLHQIIEVPWNLYLMSRPRRSPRTVSQKDASTADQYHRAASSELRALELFYLTLSVLSPFLGTLLLRSVIVSVSGPSTISWFSTSLFVLATGRRPWEHAIERLRQRTTDLQNLIHYPPSEAQKTQSQLEALVKKAAQLETELKSLKEQFKNLNTEIYEQVEDVSEVMEKAARKQEKKIETTRTSFEARLMKLEQNVDVLLERREIRADSTTFHGNFTGVSTFFSALTDQLSPMLPAWATSDSRNKGFPSPRSSPKMGRPRAASKLETIPEIATFQPKSSGNPFSLHIPGLGVALRIGDLATLPIRRVISYLLAGQIYTPRKPVSPE